MGSLATTKRPASPGSRIQWSVFPRREAARSRPSETRRFSVEGRGEPGSAMPPQAKGWAWAWKRRALWLEHRGSAAPAAFGDRCP